MKKITIIINNLGVGGAERLVVDDVNEMIKRGIEVNLITLRPEKEKSFKDQCLISDQNFNLVKFDGLFDIPSWIKLIRLLKKQNPDVLITHLWFSNTIGRISGLMAGVPKIICFEQNVYDNVKTWKQFFIDRILQNFCYKIIAISGSVMESLIKNGIRSEKIIVLFNAINIERYKNAEIKQSIISDLKIPKDQFIFLFVGRLISQKGVDVLIKAFSKLKEGVLLIVGDGVDKESLNSLVNELVISDRVLFLGIRHDIPELFKVSDCFVFPSRWEGLGVVILEAMASGTPIITTNFGAAVEILKNRNTGMISKIDDVDELYSLMKTIMDDPVLRKELSNNAQMEVEKYSISKHIEGLLEII